MSVVCVPHQAQDALHAVVDQAERARLCSVAPHLKVRSGRQRLAAERSGRLLATTLPRACRIIKKTNR